MLLAQKVDLVYQEPHFSLGKELQCLYGFSLARLHTLGSSAAAPPFPLKLSNIIRLFWT